MAENTKEARVKYDESRARIMRLTEPTGPMNEDFRSFVTAADALVASIDCALVAETAEAARFKRWVLGWEFMSQEDLDTYNEAREIGKADAIPSKDLSCDQAAKKLSADDEADNESD